MKMILFFFTACLALLTAGCANMKLNLTPPATSPPSETSIPSPIPPTVHASTATPSTSLMTRIEPSATIPATAEPVTPPEPAATLAPGAWKSLPIVPQIDPRVKEIYQKGLELGNDPHAFSKIGDCGSTPAWFLGDFDLGPKYYSLGDYQYLQGVIQEFQGSYGRTSLAAKSGFNASSVFTPLWANRSQCKASETPLDCEYRVHKPIIALITLGTNDVWHKDSFEPQMRKIIETSIADGIVPVLATKADDVEGDGSLNATIASLAAEYKIPLWNFWLAVQPLPDHGLQKDGAHITWAPNRFDDPQAMEKGWPVRNLTALQVLDAVWRAAASP